MSDLERPLGPIDPPETFGAYTLTDRLAVDVATELVRAKAHGIEGFERTVTVRRLLPAFGPETEVGRAFVEEAKRVAKLQHASIAQIVDLGRVGDTYYYASEFVDGPTLGELAGRAAPGGGVPIALTAHIIQRVLDALEYAHNRTDEAGHPLELLHRGLGPEDVRLSLDGQVKLVSFGSAAAAIAAGATFAGLRRGYMSPEQVRGLPLDRRSDTFTVGTLFWELLTGQALFTGSSDFEVLEKIRKVEVAPPSLLNASISAELEEIVLRALAPTLQARYQTAHHMGRELQRFISQAELYASDADLRGFVRDTAELAGVTSPTSWTRPLLGGGVTAPVPASPGLSWDDEEIETSIFGRGGDAGPADGEELGEWSESMGTLVRPAPGGANADAAAARAAELIDAATGAADAGASASAHPLPSAEVPVVAIAPSPDAGPTLEPTVERFASASPPVTPASSKPAQRKPPRASAPATAAPAGPAPARPAATTTTVPVTRDEKSSGLWWVAAALAVGALLILLFVGRGGDDLSVVRVSVSPGAGPFEVVLDGSVVASGVPPFSVSGVRPGAHSLTVRGDGYVERTGAVEVSAGSDVDLNWELSAVPTVEVPVQSSPSGASIRLNGAVVGTTPSTVTMRVGDRVELALELDGYEPQTSRFLVAERAATVMIALTAQAPSDGSGKPPVAAGPATDGSGAPAAEVAAAVAPAEVPPVAAPTDPAPAPAPAAAVAAASAPTPAPSTPTAAARPAAPASAPPAASASAPRPAAARPAAPAQTAPASGPSPAELARLEAERQAREARLRQQQAEAQAAAAAPAADGPPGFVNVQSQPPARIFVDGADTGHDTPVAGLQLPPGPHRIELVNDAAGVRRTYRVTIESGRTRNIVNVAE